MVSLGAAKMNRARPKKAERKSFYVGQILRSSFLNKNYTKINSDQKTILIMGGSQGSEFFNKVIPKIFNEIKDINLSFKIYHQCRENDLNTTKDMYSSQHKVEVFNFKNNIEEIMKKSDLAITRSGSNTVTPSGISWRFPPILLISKRRLLTTRGKLIRCSTGCTPQTPPNPVIPASDTSRRVVP